jgi:hypothetical protein
LPVHSPRDTFGGALEIGAYHTLRGEGDSRPFLLPRGCAQEFSGKVRSKKIEGNGTSLSVAETVKGVREEKLPHGMAFRIDIV